METIRIKYFSDEIEKLDYIDGKSDWIDLRASEQVTLKAGEFKLIPLGVAMQLPEGYEAQLLKHGELFRLTVWALLMAHIVVIMICGECQYMLQEIQQSM